MSANHLEVQFIENRTYDEISVGESATLTRTLRPEDIQMFAIMSGDINPAHVDPEYARSSMFHEVIAHGMWGGALISTVLGTAVSRARHHLHRPDTAFLRPVRIGDTLTVTVTCQRKFDHNHHIILDCVCTNQDGQKVIHGTAEVLAPTEKVRRPRMQMPELKLSRTREAALRPSDGNHQGTGADLRWPSCIPAIPNRSRARCWRATRAGDADPDRPGRQDSRAGRAVESRSRRAANSSTRRTVTLPPKRRSRWRAKARSMR